MNIYDSLLGAVHSEYDVLMLIKKSERGEVSLVRHRDSGTRYIFRHFYGNSEVYQKLLNVSCPNLPQIMEVGEQSCLAICFDSAIVRRPPSRNNWICSTGAVWPFAVGWTGRYLCAWCFT